MFVNYVYHNFPASIATESGLKGEIAVAIESALIYSLHFRISGNTEKDVVVFPAPFAPAIIYKFGFLFKSVHEYI